MGEPLSGMPPRSEAASDDRLDSWKEIAAHLRRDVTTVQRWEKKEGMPVHRHVHEKLGSVYAFRAELDAWARGRQLSVAHQREQEKTSPPGRWIGRRRIFGGAIGAAVLLAGIAAWTAMSSGGGANPLDGAVFRTLTGRDDVEQAASVSRDGRFVAFLSTRDGHTDVWISQVGTGQFYDLTKGRFRQLVNPSVRTLRFSPDGSLVTFWARGADSDDPAHIAIWSVPTLGGQPTPYLDGVAELDWSRDGSSLVYHTPGPGDPMFVKAPGDERSRPMFAAAAGLHAHFPLWSHDDRFIYFVQGSLPDAMDIWRINRDGGSLERITHHNSEVSHPVLLDDRTLLYLATDGEGAGPWLHAIDLVRRIPRRIGSGVDRYTSLAASADGRRVVATLAKPSVTLWRTSFDDALAGTTPPTPIALTTGAGFSPRLGPDYLVYVSSHAESDTIWKLAGGAVTKLWDEPRARVVGGPEVSPDGRQIAFTVARDGQTLLDVMNADGTDVRPIKVPLAWKGHPGWSPDGRSLALSAAVDERPQLFRIGLDGSSSPLVREYSIDPVWSPAGDVVMYSGADIGTTFPVKAVTSDGAPRAVPHLTLTRGARRMRFVRQGHALLLMRGDIEHKNLWLVDLDTHEERQVTDLPADFSLRDFDIAANGRDIVLERIQERSEAVIIDRRPGK